MISAYVTNLGRYNEGCLDGEWLNLPTDTQTVQALLGRIHVDGRRYEEIFITDYETEVDGLLDCLHEFDNLDELNYLAALLDEMDTGEQQKFGAAVEYGEHTNTTAELINLAQNLESYDLYAGIEDESDLGYYLIDEMCLMDIPDKVRPYFDYEAYGRDFQLAEGGHFATSGYIAVNGGRFIEYYDGKDIPEEHRVFSYPAHEKASIRETLEYYQQQVDATRAPEPNRPSSREDR